MARSRLLLLHGAIGAASQLQPLCESLKDSFEVHTLNFSGHGGREFAESFGIDQFANDLESFITRHDYAPIDIFGYSMGGYVALHLAATKPRLIGRIFTLGTKFSWSPETATKEVKMLDPEKIAEKVPAFAEALKKRHHPQNWTEVLAKTKEMMLSLGQEPLLTNQRLQQVTQPTIIGLGELDNMVSEEESKLVAEALPNGKFHYFEGFKHPIEQVAIGKLSESIKSFFTN
ncbi:alpha/beta hydrolase [Fulvivirga sp. RKSG066]|uniref:alpha/beta fold hydrolase n=1 Tax=Fulvivirga aurantia TaxID=2529383 RepID=UPI0012BB7F1F|nr:alpha/beta fold hydrolase [Fulvivirga aurantia]MTI23320.1 alpha/beta hydrolase [Fulvivirga aurantia]